MHRHSHLEPHGEIYFAGREKSHFTVIKFRATGRAGLNSTYSYLVLTWDLLGYLALLNLCQSPSLSELTSS